MVMQRRGRRGQSGQAVVIIAGAMVALLAMVGLILMGGTSYWERRHLQELADSAALAASIKAGGDCTSTQALVVADMARAVLEAQLGPHTSGPSLSGTCPGPGWVVTYGFGDGTTAAINWPFAYHSNDWVQATLTHQIALQLPGFVGPNANIAASAIAEANSRNRPGNYALYAYRGITCNGAGITIIKGSVYSGGVIDKNCSLWVQEVKSGETTDFGDILVYPKQPAWSQGGGNCGTIIRGKPSNAICADGYEESGNPATCAAPYSSGGTAYIDASQLQPGPGGVVPNPMPCPGDAVPAPDWTFALTPDPNFGVSARAFGAPCPVGAPYPTATFPGAKGPVMRASTAVTVAAAPDAKGMWHFHPGCYAWIDVANVPGGTAVLDPGFYFFNGYFAAGDPSGVKAGGLALNGSNGRLLGQDVTLEFVNQPGGASSFSGTEILPASKTASACGGGNSCYLGADPTKPIDGFTYFAAPCSQADPLLEAGCPTSRSAWCQQIGTDDKGRPKYDTSCYDVLVWAPPPGPSNLYEPAPIGGSFWFKGTGSYEWVYGAIEWPGNCAWSANGSSILIGQMICDIANIQGGTIATGPGVKFGSTGKNHFNNEPGLKA